MRILTLMMLMVVGCGKGGEITIGEPKGLSFEEQKLVGSYEVKADGNTAKLVFLENRVFEIYNPLKLAEMLGDSRMVKSYEGAWEIAGKEVHASHRALIAAALKEDTSVFKIEPNGDLTMIAEIEDGKRKDLPKEEQHTYKKIK